MRRYKDRAAGGILKTVRARLIAISAALLFILAVIFEISLNISLKPVICELAESYGAPAVVEIINDSVSEFFEDNRIGYSDLARLRYNQSGFVTSIEYDSFEINRMKTACLEKLQKDLSALRSAKIKIPLGSLFNDIGASGRGPRIGVKITESAIADIEVLSTFESVGINQSRHEIRMRVSADVSAYLPPQSAKFTVSQEYVLAQTVIVGNVPTDNLYLDRK